MMEEEAELHCTKCDFVSRSHSSMTRHMKGKHNEQYEPPYQYTCDLCPYATGSKMNFVLHVRSHANPQQFVCSICHRSYKNKSSLNKHKQSHRNNPFFCTKCNNKFVYKSNMKTHMKTCKGRQKPTVRRFRCKECSKEFLSGVSLQMHMREHEDIMELKCTYCNFVSDSQEVLSSHMEDVHQIAKDVIEEGNDYNVILQRIKKEPGLEEEEVGVGNGVSGDHDESNQVAQSSQFESESGHICSECGFVATSNGGLRYHRMKTHPTVADKAKMPTCKLCDEKFLYPSQYNRHLIKHYKKGDCYQLDNDAPIGCPYCSFNTSNWNYVYKHIKRMHPFYPKVTRQRPNSSSNDTIQDFYGTTTDNIQQDEEVGSSTISPPSKKRKSRLYACDLCDFSSWSHGSLSYHKKKVHSTHRFKCSMCSYKAVSRCDVIKHQKRHNKGKPYICKSCGDGFESKKKLNAHMANCHDGPLAEPEEEMKVVEEVGEEEEGEDEVADTIVDEDGKEITLVTEDKSDDSRPFKCDECGRSFKHRNNLQLHKLSHTVVRIHQCQLCSFAATSAASLGTHMSEEHDIEQKEDEDDDVDENMSQLEGSEEYDESEDVTNGVQSSEQPMFVRKGGLYKCKLCAYRSKYPSKMSRHVKIHTPITKSTSFSCNHCNYMTRYKFALKKHVMKKHKQNLDGTPAFEESRGELSQPMKVSESNEEMLTEVNFDSPTGVLPTDDSSGSSRFIIKCTCRACHGKAVPKDSVTREQDVFTNANEMLIQKVQKENNVLWECSICDKSFTEKIRCLRHSLIHTGEKPYTCSHCSRQFNLRSNAKRHIIIHIRNNGGEKLSKCTICNKIFAFEGQLKYHLRTQHVNGDVAFEEAYDTDVDASLKAVKDSKLAGSLSWHGEMMEISRRFRCRYCNSTIVGRANFVKHICSHTGQTPMSCNICGKLFYDRTLLYKHKLIHKRKASTCKGCGKVFTVPARLAEHKVTCIALKRLNNEVLGPHHGKERSVLGVDTSGDVDETGMPMPIISSVYSLQSPQAVNTDSNARMMDVRHEFEAPNDVSNSQSYQSKEESPLLSNMLVHGRLVTPQKSLRSFEHNSLSPRISPCGSLMSEQDRTGSHFERPGSMRASTPLNRHGEGKDTSNHSPTNADRENSVDSKCTDCLRNSCHQLKCIHCGLIFLDVVMHTLHMGWHGNRNPFECHGCGKDCGDKYSFISHIFRESHK
ncbi:zinc finger protein 728-like [Anneissia japonica]|uniref:zinc finger protein 728-like n=1 Tax=Anneissia japonica TaxID=1529436 RepID=UPI0014254EC1|nr:zinc finger protein 728-like [Anneissia japonica]XP_033125141.1 zinc finger protein 728-like [Anneissia japonica]XP_033125142.1 zinc finger protein 728-like [Anneissia japonica]